MLKSFEKTKWLNSQLISINRLIKKVPLTIALVIHIIYLIAIVILYMKNGSLDLNLDEILIMLIVLVLFYSSFFIIMLSMIKVKKELTKVNVENINTIKVEVQKVRYMIIPTSKNSEINPYLVIKYKYNNKKYKGYYFPIYYTFNSPKELKNKLLNLKRINIYKNTSVIECIDFYDNDYIF